MHLSISIAAIPLEPRPTSSHHEGAAGAVVEFAGIVRDTENGRPLLGLTYESYTPMAIRQISHISHRLNDQYPIISIDFHHRIGLVHYGEASLFIRVRSERRINALRFTEHFIDLLKQEVPIWKHPVFKADR